MATFDLDRPWRLRDSVALRPERFGALAYDFETRRLSFLKSRRLHELVECLSEHPSARVACEASGVGEAELDAYERALTVLATSGLIKERAEA